MHHIDHISPNRPLRVLMLSWDYAPLGDGRGPALPAALATAGHEVTVVTRYAKGAADEEYHDGVRVVRASEGNERFGLSTLLASTMAANPALTRSGLRAAKRGRVDVIHACDWRVAHTAATLKEHLGLPLVATFDATEAGRNRGWLFDNSSRTIHSIEGWLARHADRVIVGSESLRDEVSSLLETPTDRLDVVPVGVDSAAWQAPTRAVAAARARFAGAGPLIGYAGRLVHEKGVHDLIAAMPALRALHPGVRLVVAGEGPYIGVLREEIRRRKLHRAVSFTGRLAQPDLAAVMAATDAFVVPSIYEPIGTVALEAASAGTPLAVATTGGLAEIVQCGVTGMTFPAQNPRALAGAVSTLLDDDVFARRIAKQAQAWVAQQYSWETAALRTAGVYTTAVREVSRAGAGPRGAAAAKGGRGAITLAAGTLLAGVAS